VLSHGPALSDLCNAKKDAREKPTFFLLAQSLFYSGFRVMSDRRSMSRFSLELAPRCESSGARLPVSPCTCKYTVTLDRLSLRGTYTKVNQGFSMDSLAHPPLYSIFLRLQSRGRVVMFKRYNNL
jgi:hypothetical protein